MEGLSTIGGFIAIDIFGFFFTFRLYQSFFVRRDIGRYKFILMFVIFLSMQAMMNYFIESMIFLVLFSISVNYVFAQLFFKAKWQMKLVVSLFVVIFHLVTELITGLIINIVFMNAMSQIRETPLLLIVGGVFSRILFMIIVEIIIKYRSRKIMRVTIRSWVLIVSIPLISLFICISNVYSLVIHNQYSTLAMLTCIGILYINLLEYYLFDRIINQIDENNQIKSKEKQLLQQKEYYENIIKKYTEIRKIRHDMLSHVIVVKSLFERNERERAIHYLNELSNLLDMQGVSIETKNPVLDAILNNGINKAKEMGIDVKHKINVPEVFEISDMDLCILLGNILTNAIEACERLEEGISKYIEIDIEYEYNQLAITVENSYDRASIVRQGKKFITSRREKENHGIGVQSIRDIVYKYNGKIIFSQKERFITEVVLYDKKIA